MESLQHLARLFLMKFWISFNYSVGWRLDDEYTFAEWYKEIKEVFGYNREIY